MQQYNALILTFHGEEVYYAAPGEIVEVTYTVGRADLGFCAMQTSIDLKRSLVENYYEISEDIPMMSTNKLFKSPEDKYYPYTKEPIPSDKACLFFAYASSSNKYAKGKSEIKIKVMVPDDAEYGTEYPLEVLVNESLIFSALDSASKQTDLTTHIRNNPDKYISNCKIVVSSPGDINADGMVTILDVIMLQKYIHNVGIVTDWQAGDLNNDGMLDVFDLALLKRKIYTYPFVSCDIDGD